MSSFEKWIQCFTKQERTQARCLLNVKLREKVIDVLDIYLFLSLTDPSLMKEKHGVNVLWSRYMFDYLQDVGDMTDMHRRINPLRFGSTGPAGKFIDTSLRSVFESRRLFFEDCFNIPTAIYNETVNKIVNQAINCHSFFNYHLCWGRKPLLDYDSTASIRKGSAASVLTHEDKSFDKADMDYSDSCDISSISADNELYIDQFIEGFEE